MIEPKEPLPTAPGNSTLMGTLTRLLAGSGKVFVTLSGV
jgi:hypothetical protein